MKVKSSFKPSTLTAALIVFLVGAALAPAYAIKIPQDNVHVDLELSMPRFTDRYEFHNEKIYRIEKSVNIDGVRSTVVEEYDLSGNHLSSFVTPSFASDDDFVTVDADRRVYIYNDSIPSGRTGLIQIYDWEGNLLHDFAAPGDGPGELNPHGRSISLSVSPKGNLYVTEGFNSYGNGTRDSLRLSVFDSEGNFLFSFSTGGILASTLESHIETVLLSSLEDGTEEIWVLEGEGENYFKIFDESGTFLRLFDVSQIGSSGRWEAARILDDQIFVHYSSRYYSPRNNQLLRTSCRLDSWVTLGAYEISDDPVGKAADGRLLTETYEIFRIWSSPTLRTYDPLYRDAVPDPFVTSMVQRGGSTVMDIDFRVDDANDATVSVAALAFVDGTTDLLNVVELNSLVEGTESKLGDGIPTGTVHRISWDAASDWNVDFGNINVTILARDSRPHWFDVHLVEIPADGDRPAVTITRNPLDSDDFLAQWFWLIATKDPSISLVDGQVFATGGTYDGELLASGTETTAIGREFLLARDGLRVASEAEVERAREGATPGFVAELTPRQRIKTSYERSRWYGHVLPGKVNEFGIETGIDTWLLPPDSDAIYWYAVLAD